MTVSPDQRHKRRNPCLICGGGEDDRPRQGIRCAGFISEDGQTEHCERVESPWVDENALPLTYAHKVHGNCPCGHPHKSVPPGQDSAGKKQEHIPYRAIAEYVYFTADGDPLFKVVRMEAPNPDGGKPLKTFPQYRYVGLGQWEKGISGVQRVLYRLPELRKADPAQPVYIVEGEKCADYLAVLGCVVTTASGGALNWTKTPSAREALRGRHAVILPDNDGPNAEKPQEAHKGQRHAKQVADDLAGVAASVRVLELPGLPLTGDVVDWLDAGGTKEQLLSLARLAPLAADWTPPGTTGEARPALLGVSLGDVEIEDFHWLWHRRVALGKITTFDGDGGVGKSLATIDLIARVVMHRGMPDGSPGLDAPAGAVIICGEDGLADTVKPRCLAAGVSPETLRQGRVRAINLVPESLADGTISQRLIDLLRDLLALEATLTTVGARLLVIDPITAYLGNGVDMYKDAEVRRVLTPLALMAERTGVAVVMTRHLNRGNGAPAQHRGLGSVAFLNVARLGLLFAPNPDAKGEVLISRYKGNIGAPPPTLAYRIVQVGEAENMPRISWLGEREKSAEAALASQSGADKEDITHSLDEAMEFLRAELKAYDVSATDMMERAKNLGISKRTLDRARAKLTVRSYKMGYGKDAPWMWAKIASDTGEDCHPPDAGNLRTETGSNGATEADSAEGCQASEDGSLHGMNGNLHSDHETGEIPDYDPAA